MATPSASAMLEAWERGIGQGAVERGLTLLALADPETDRRSLAELNIGERDRRLLGLREVCFGPRMTGLVSCVRCHEELEIELTTTELRGLMPSQIFDPVLRADGYVLRLCLPDSRDLLSSVAATADDAVRMLLRACVDAASIDGENIAPDALSPQLVAAAARRLAEADPLADLRLAFACAGCGHRWQVPFDIVPFLWIELDAWAGRMLQEVHALASAYHWTEREILSLAPARRRQYLRMVDA